MTGGFWLVLGAVALLAPSSTFSEGEEGFSKRSSSSENVTPKCERPNGDRRRFDAIYLSCECAPTSRLFYGQLSAFLLGPLSDAMRERVEGDPTSYSHNRSVALRGCDEVGLSLDFGALPGGGGGATFMIKVEDAEEVHVNYAGLAFDQRHVFALSNVTHRASISGSVECYQCANRTKSSSLDAEHSPALLQIDASSVRDLDVYDVEADTPLRLTVRDSESASVTGSVFQTVPWPGFYFDNVTRVAVVGNEFLDSAHRAMAAKKVDEIVVSDNVLDFSTALDISQYQHMTIKCNRPSLDSPRPDAAMCSVPPGGLPGLLEFVPDDWENIVVALFFLFVVGGFLYLAAAIVLCLLLSLVCCVCCPCINRPKPKKGKGTDVEDRATALESQELILKKKPTSILKQHPTDFDANGRARQQQQTEGGPSEEVPENYVKIEKVTEEPMGEEADGVVHGSITLGGEWPKGVKKIRAVEEQQQDEGAEGAAATAQPPNEVKLVKRKKRRQREDLDNRPTVVVVTAPNEEGQHDQKEEEPTAQPPPPPQPVPKKQQERARTTSPAPSSTGGRETPPPSSKAKAAPAPSRRITRSELKTLREVQLREKEAIRGSRIPVAKKGGKRSKSVDPSQSAREERREEEAAAEEKPRSKEEGETSSLGRYTTV